MLEGVDGGRKEESPSDLRVQVGGRTYDADGETLHVHLGYVGQLGSR